MTASGPARVAVVRASGGYPKCPPYHPSEPYPEVGPVQCATEPNHAYAAVRNALAALDLDTERFGAEDWNPLNGIVRPGDSVVIKPNWIRESAENDSDWECIITHPSVIRAVADYVGKALSGKGSICLADAPQADADFDVLRELAHVDDVARAVSGRWQVPVEIVDIRKFACRTERHVVVGRRELSGDPKGYVSVDLGPLSEFAGHSGVGRYYGADYDYAEVNAHHDGTVNEYLVSGTALSADAVINLPKLKTHRKAGITCCLKNLVGVSGDKNWLPHYTRGPECDGGDEFLETGWRRRLESVLTKAARRCALASPRVLGRGYALAKAVGLKVFGRRTSRGGGWHGNDTLWRMVLDLNKILFYADSRGQIAATRRRRYLAVVDGILAGEGEGPLAPEAVEADLVIAGVDPVATDSVCAAVMGFDPSKIPCLHHAFETGKLSLTSTPLDEITVAGEADLAGRLADLRSPSFRFRPPSGWAGHVGIDRGSETGGGRRRRRCPG